MTGARNQNAEDGVRNRRRTSAAPRCCPLAVGAALLLIVGTTSARAYAEDAPTRADEKTPESDERRQQREENLKLMAQRAVASKVRQVGEADISEVVLVPKPLFHYSDQPRRIVDATLWGWIAEGRLQAVCKIEKYDRGTNPQGEWLYCCGSLATGLIDVEFADGHRWSARKPGIALSTIADGPIPAEGPAARLRQMKELANRFSATIVNTTLNTTQEMRLLPRPIYRYEKPTGDLRDGAVFGVTANGTNPDSILVLELHKPDDGALQWRYGLAGMTQDQLSVKFDGKEVWAKPQVRSAGNFDTWTYFLENK